MASVLLDMLAKTLRALSALCLAAVLVLVLAQVLFRYVLDYPLPSAAELSIYAMIWGIFLGAAVALRQGDHIAVIVFRNMLPGPARRTLEVFSFLILILFLLIVSWHGYDLAERAMHQLSTASRIPVGYVAMAMPVCSALSIVFLIEKAVREWLPNGR